MINTSGMADVYTDFSGLAKLRTEAKAKSPEALKQTAKQFESLFIQMALKSMRKATQESGLTNSQHSKFYRDMYDQQMAVELGKSSRMGLADMLVQQLGGKPENRSLAGKSLAEYREGSIPAIETDLSETRQSAAKIIERMVGGIEKTPTPSRQTLSNHPDRFDSPEQFVATLWPEAQAAATELGVDPKMLLAQAALESGWGKAVMHAADGSDSHNLFGIKADRSWGGRSVGTQTLEYENGVAIRKRAAFRAYDSYADSFRDYVGFLRDNPRYTQALKHADNPERFIAGLQKAGYATDPNYARKVMSIYRGNAAFERLDTA